MANIVAEPNAVGRRRIGAANKALNSRLLAATGGRTLLMSCGFTPDPPAGEAEAYVCSRELAMVRVAFATLEKGPMIWEELAATRSAEGDGGGGGGGGGGGAPKLSADEPSVALESIVIKSLPACGDPSRRRPTAHTYQARHTEAHRLL